MGIPLNSHASDAGYLAESYAADERFRAMQAADEASRVPQTQEREWREYARRHGTMHPDEQRARIARGSQARADDWAAGTRPFVRTGGSIAEMGRTQRQRQRRPVSEPMGAGWDNLNDPELHEPATMHDGGPFRGGYRHAGYYR
jgi:hypothetical protein